MELKVTGTNLELTEGARQHIQQKLGKLNKHLPGIIETRVEVSEEKTKSPQQQFLVRVTITSAIGGAAFHGEERGPDLSQAIDKLSGVMTRQLEKHKGKLYDKGRGSSLARGEAGGETSEGHRIVKKKKFTLEAMTVEVAVRQMEELGHSFFLYLDEETDELKLLYRRNDGDYGLIEPEIS